MADISTIKRDVAAESAGVLIPFDQVPGISFRIARTNNPNYTKLLDEMTKDIRGAWIAGDLPQEKVDEILDTVASRTLLTGWEGIEDGEPLVPVPYSHSQSFIYMHDPQFADVRNFVLWHARNGENYRLAARKKALGN